ncbi:hypothetical protein [Streptomyces asiaticus]|uniref:hypothetical protein n=1 Tax=Streptomyces asiaticus TaxID=114695 RepID=UPI0038187EE4
MCRRSAAKAPDLIGRDFTATEPDTKYVGDITCLRLDGAPPGSRDGAERRW